MAHGRELFPKFPLQLCFLQYEKPKLICGGGLGTNQHWFLSHPANNSPQFCGVCVQDLLKDFLDKKDKGELMIQKATNLLKTILKEVSASLRRKLLHDKVSSSLISTHQPCWLAGGIHFGWQKCQNLCRNPTSQISVFLHICQYTSTFADHATIGLNLFEIFTVRFQYLIHLSSTLNLYCFLMIDIDCSETV